METALPEMTIAYYIASPTWGGGEQYVYNLAKALRETQEVSLVFFFPRNSNHEMIVRFKELGECPSFGFTSKIGRFFPWIGKQLAKLLDQYHVDILHLNSRSSYFIGAWAKYFAQHPIRLIATQHLVKPAKNSLIWRWAYRQIDQLICVSNCVRQAYLSPWKGAQNPFCNTTVVLNSVPMHADNVICNQDTPCPIILYHGRICKEKGIFPLMDYLESIRDLNFEVWMVGNIDPSCNKEWEDRLHSSPIANRIKSLGFRTDTQHIIAQCHIGVIPSLVPEAGGPLVLLENMAMGLPTITNNNGSQAEYICHHQNGWLCQVNSQKDWQEGMRQLIQSPALRMQLGEQAQKDFNTYHPFGLHIKSMSDIYWQHSHE